jgi:hypothetical protein|tara:strand:+ start:1144 stop:1392 length:249 start_codon:yes stop_codon:yes gene_type:complete
MKIKELKKELSKFDENDEVYISQDSEGNAIKKIDEMVVYQNGDYTPVKEGEKGEIINGKELIWKNGEKFLTIFPTDEIVAGA